MTDYCDWSDLPKDQCHHCRTGEKSVGVRAGGAGLSKFGHGSTHPDSATIDALLGGTSPDEGSRHVSASRGGGRPFSLKWGAACDECGEWIREGEEGRYNEDGKIVHADGELCG